jgi:hypothetical protein
MGHSIGLDDHYFTPVDTYVLRGYLKVVDYLTINEENRLRLKLDELTKNKDEIEIMELKHREEIGTIKQQMNQIMMIVQRNPRLVNIKPASKPVSSYAFS